MAESMGRKERKYKVLHSDMDMEVVWDGQPWIGFCMGMRIPWLSRRDITGGGGLFFFFIVIIPYAIKNFFSDWKRTFVCGVILDDMT